MVDFKEMYNTKRCEKQVKTDNYNIFLLLSRELFNGNCTAFGEKSPF
jgi:hypothetical protein